MGTVDDTIPAGPPAGSASVDLTQLMATARSNTVSALERLLETTETGELPHQIPAGTGFLMFVCGGRDCAVALSSLREVLPAVPRTVYLPFSPEWMVGIFPLRNEMLGLVDPVPLLTRNLHTADSENANAPVPIGSISPDRAPATALIVGSEDRCLAWAVDSVGDIALAKDDELHELDELTLSDLPFRRHYVMKLYTPGGSTTSAFVIHAEALLTDLLEALELEEKGLYG